MNQETNQSDFATEGPHECPFCNYPVLFQNQQTCTECGERVTGDEAWMRRREWQIIWDRYRWVLILGVLAVASIATLVLNRYVTANWLLMQLMGTVAVSTVLGMFIKHTQAQLVALSLIGGLVAQFLWCADLRVADTTIILIGILLSAWLSSGLVMAGVVCGAILRHACWEQCKRDLGHK